MTTKSINQNGCSTCGAGREHYTTFITNALRGTQYFQYDYRHIDGELFACIGRSLKDCRKRRDKWLNKNTPVERIDSM